MIVHSSSFVKKWRLILVELYGYESYMEYLIVPSITGKKNLSYLPLLSYTDKEVSDIDSLVELGKESNYLIRAINETYIDFKDGDTVTMRLDLSSGSYDFIYKNHIHSKCRNQIQKSLKSKLVHKIGAHELLEDFYMLFAKTMHRYGTPVFTIKLFKLILEKLNARIIVVYKNNVPIASSLLIFDGGLIIVPWAASDYKFSKFCPNHLMYSESIKYALENKCTVFDFGRSKYGSGNTYKFKKQWGAAPIKIDMLSSNKDDIYSKYSLASSIWKKLPKIMVNSIGPKLCKYLPDL